MTQSQPVTRVVAILTDARYRHLQTPITVASVPFEFAALLIGSDRANDLVVIIDTLIDSEARIDAVETPFRGVITSQELR